LSKAEKILGKKLSKTKKKIIKEDINFLEYPTWVLDRRSKENSWVLDKPNGKYEIASLKGLPTHFDKLVLYCLLYKLYNQTQFSSLELVTTRYEIARQVFSTKKVTGKNKFDRIMTSLRKWKAIAINFEGMFFEGDGHTIRGFSIIDEFILRPQTRALTIRFSPAYIKQLQESKFYKLIDFEQYKKLTRALAARLYEILIKNFRDRAQWTISIQNLAEKLTLEKRAHAKNYYPCDILAQVNPAISEINKKTDILIDFKYNKEKALCTFKKLKKTNQALLKQSYQAAVPFEEKKQARLKQLQIQQCMSFFNALPLSEQQDILAAANKDAFVRYIPDDSAKIYLYLTAINRWQPTIE
jgi:hypothetical protein